jgi:hypothetical protein
MKLKFFFLLLLSLYIVNCTLTIEAQATVRYVSKTGTSQFPYTSPETAADSIQKCINICSFGDTVYVANGVYKEKVIMTRGLALIGSGIDSCIIDTRQLPFLHSDVTLIGNDSCYIEGLDIYTKYSSLGIGIRQNNSNIIFCRVQFASLGIDAIPTYQDRRIVSKCIITNVWDGIVCEGKPLISENIISANITALTSQINSSPTYYNNIINGDNCDVAFYDASGFVSKLINNQFVGNGNYVFWSYGNDSITNNIIYGDNGVWGVGILGAGSKAINNNFQNNSTVLYYDQPGGTPQTFKYNNLWENGLSAVNATIDSTNIFNNPMFVNKDSMDFHLQKYSPLIDAGDPAILDKDGSRSDIGLYGGPYGENYKYIDLAPAAPLNLTALVDSNYITLNWNRNTEADTSFYNVYRDTVVNFQIDSTKLISSQTDTFFVQINPHNVTKYVYKITCVDKQGNESQPGEELVVNITSVSIDDYPMTINDYRLYQNYPNPFNPSTTISYRLKERGYVKLYVYDIKGELVSTLVNQNQEAGFYEIEFSLSNIKNPASSIQNLASGIYLYQLMVKSERDIPVFTDIKKMLIIK